MHFGYIHNQIGLSWGSSAGRRAVGDGPGLGLSIVAATVQVHHGVVEVVVTT
ncbi:hypothetical protein ACQP2T_51870 [Nonomuraea sp. CA-143628]|uniref:hypothetical protein n=1 Tax=Nonomuraea sp. CA-143628 TaxID=3239997 RepID=UPI003D8CCE17